MRFDPDTSILLCQSLKNNKKLWVKKLFDLKIITNIIEDKRRYYLSCNSGDRSGQFIAIQKKNGLSDWFIPGKSFLNLIYKGFLYLIFPDEQNRFYLLKVRLTDGKSLWFHPIDSDLYEYIFIKEKLKLKYYSGKIEMLSIRTGELDIT